MADGFMQLQQVENALQRLHGQTVGVYPQAAKALQQVQANKIGTVRHLQARQVNVSVAVAQAVKAFRRQQSQRRAGRTQRAQASANPLGAGSFPVSPDSGWRRLVLAVER